MMNILVTGASGFIGSHLILMLKHKYQDANIICLTAKKIDGFICINHKDYTFDVTDFFREGVSEIDVVIHLGWFVAKTRDDRNDVLKNYMPLYNTEYLLKNIPGIPKLVIFCSSVSVYGLHYDDNEYSPSIELIDENTEIRPNDLYGFNKYCAELLIEDFCKKRDVLCHILRLGPVYGDGDLRGEFIGIMLRNIVMGRDLQLYADARMKRNLLYVDDICNYICESVVLKENVGVINVVADKNYSMSEIIDMIVSVDEKREVKCITCKGPYKGRDFAFCSTKKKRYFGEEKYQLNQGILKTYKWIENELNGGKE